MGEADDLRRCYRRLSGPPPKVLAHLQKQGIKRPDLGPALQNLSDGKGRLVARIDRRDPSIVLLHRRRSPRVIVLSHAGAYEGWDESLTSPSPLTVLLQRMRRAARRPRRR